MTRIIYNMLKLQLHATRIIFYVHSIIDNIFIDRWLIWFWSYLRLQVEFYLFEWYESINIFFIPHSWPWKWSIVPGCVWGSHGTRQWRDWKTQSPLWAASGGDVLTLRCAGHRAAQTMFLRSDYLRTRKKNIVVLILHTSPLDIKMKFKPFMFT